MTTKVGTLEMSEKAARKPASVEPASSRRTTAFWASRFDSYMLNLSACLGRDSKELRTHPLFSHSSSHSLLVAPSSIQFVSRVSLHIPTEHLDVPRTKQATSFCSWIASVIPLCKVPWWNMAVGGCAEWVGRVVIVRGVKLGDALELGWCLKLHLRTTAGINLILRVAPEATWGTSIMVSSRSRWIRAGCEPGKGKRCNKQFYR